MGLLSGELGVGGERGGGGRRGLLPLSLDAVSSPEPLPRPHPCASYTINHLRPSNNSLIICLLENISVYKLLRKMLQAQEQCGISHTQNK